MLHDPIVKQNTARIARLRRMGDLQDAFASARHQAHAALIGNLLGFSKARSIRVHT